GEPGERQSHQAVEDGEAESLDEPELRIGEMQVQLDRLDRCGDALPVGEVERVHENEQREHPRRVAPGVAACLDWAHAGTSEALGRRQGLSGRRRTAPDANAARVSARAPIM